MKTIKCDRCGKDIPYVPPFMNSTAQKNFSKSIMITIWNGLLQELQEVDLCDNCKSDVYDFIFEYGNGAGA